MPEGRLIWRIGESIYIGEYSEAFNLLTEWIVLTVHDAPLHFAVETALVIFVLALIFIRRKPAKGLGRGLDLDEKTVDELCEDWKPRPLAGVEEHDPEIEFPAPPLVDKYCAPYVEVGGSRLLDLSSFGFLGLANNREVVEAAKRACASMAWARAVRAAFTAHLTCICRRSASWPSFLRWKTPLCLAAGTPPCRARFRRLPSGAIM